MCETRQRTAEVCLTADVKRSRLCLPVERYLHTFNEEVIITALQFLVSWQVKTQEEVKRETFSKKNQCYRKSLTVQTVPYFTNLKVYPSERRKDPSVCKTDLKLQDLLQHPPHGCLAGPRQVGAPSCQLSANFQLSGLVGCVLLLLWAADLTELVARATASTKDPPLCFFTESGYFDNLRDCRRRGGSVEWLPNVF